MEDEKYVYFQDLREKKVTGYSARKQRSHCGKRGRVKFPSDYLTKKELKNMSGECKSYRLNEPMKWADFKKMPSDVQIMYVEAIKQKFNASDATIARMLGIVPLTFTNWKKEVGLPTGKKRSSREKWDEEGFTAWVYGLPKIEECQSVQEEADELSVEVVLEVVEEETTAVTVAEEDLPWNKPEEEEDPVPVHHTYVSLDSQRAIPETGSMTFTGNATQIMNTLVNLLGNAKVVLSVNWNVVED